MKQQLTPILLPTYTESKIYSVGKQIAFRDKAVEVIGSDYGNHYLYLVNKEEITRQEACWHYNHVFKTISNESSSGYAKIIASTDINLNLPKIPQDFIKYFVEKQGNVGKVMVEYGDKGQEEWWGSNEEGEPIWVENIQLKLTKDNEVIISLEEKSYTRNEMIAFGQKCGTAGTMAERIGEDFNHLFLQLVEQNL